MKSLYNRLTVLLTIFAVSVTGCDGSKSSSPLPHAPSLSELYLIPSSVDQYTGNGTTDVFYEFAFADAGGDLASITMAVYDANGIGLDSATDTIEGAAGITDGYIYGYFSADTTVAGNYAINFSMTDSQGQTSNVVAATLTVMPVASVVSIDVTPANPTILKYGSQQFTATANYDDGTKLDVTTLSSWTSSDTGVATIISWSGLRGVAAGAAEGSSTITAHFSGVSGSTTLTVVDMPLISLAVTPQGPSINKDATQQMTATGTYANDMTLDITAHVSWTSSAPAVATVDSGGVVTGMAGGSAVITATSGTVHGSSTVHVVADFGPAARYPGDSGFSFGNTAIGDLNGDGRNDVVAIEGYNSRNRIVFYYQNTDHTLGTPQVITTDLSLSGVAIADVNSDGLDELVVGGSLDSGGVTLGKVYVYTQDPVTHALNVPQQYTVSTWGVASMAVADLNNDGRPDIVVSNDGYEGNIVISMLFQGPTGTLASEATYSGIHVYWGAELHVADMNNDGMNDIVLQSDALQLVVIKQVSPGQFSTSPDYYTVQNSFWPGSSRFYSFALGDLNGDGRTDIAVADPRNNGRVNTFLQNNYGQMNGPDYIWTGSLGQAEVHIADTNGDGLNDIIAVYSTHVRILHQAANHTFPDIIEYMLPSDISGGMPTHQPGAIGDVTGEGLPDIVTTWLSNLYVLPHAQ